MPKQVVWSPLAENDFAGSLEYLFLNWGHQVTIQFIEVTEKALAHIAVNPRQFPLIYKKAGVRKYVLTKHNTIFYRENNTQIEILRIYDTRQDPEKLTFV